MPQYYLANLQLVMPTHELWDVIIFQGLGESIMRNGLEDLFKFYNVEVGFKFSFEYKSPNKFMFNIYNKTGNEIVYPVKTLMSISCRGSWKYVLHLPKHEAFRVFGGESKSITLWRNRLSMEFKVEYTVCDNQNGCMNFVSAVTKITVGWFKFVKFYGIEKEDFIAFQKID
ncbi:hypothetical protein GH714_016182 [Hevea brasiliensis]|uniref:Uncharacterized protein n=1 Tax=Hevea brasiliensis TaxID=3981 RepID=A0A6A6MDV1_HEVBR|nr:hypothetical protein GH714_016182 [Hevea brasiliensis]